MCDWRETAPGVQHLGAPDAGGQGTAAEGAEAGVTPWDRGDRGHLPHLATGIQTGRQEDRRHFQVEPKICNKDYQKNNCLNGFSA